MICKTLRFKFATPCRSIAALIMTVSCYKSEISLSYGKAESNARDIMGILTLPFGGVAGKNIVPGDAAAYDRAWAEGILVNISISGPDEERVMLALETFMRERASDAAGAGEPQKPE